LTINAKLLHTTGERGDNVMEQRRRNLRMFELIVSRLTDAELRTLAGVLEDEQDFRSHSRSHQRHSRSAAIEAEALDAQLEQEHRTIREVEHRRAPHRNHSAERVEEQPERKRSGTRAKVAGKSSTGTDG